MNMKVLQINFRDFGGGSPTVAALLTEELNKHGVVSHLGVQEKKTGKEFVIKLPEKKQRKTPFIVWLIQKAARKITKPVRNHFQFRTTNLIVHEANFKSRIDVNWINNSDYDIVHLHSLDGNIISIKDISRINKPLVWTLHDSWPCCGAEHHPNLLENDTRWQEGYTRKNKPKTTTGFDFCRKVFRVKKKYLSDKGIVFTAPSSWQQNICKTSNLFSKNRCELIPNFIDTDSFVPKSKAELRKNFCIPENKKVLGFGANYGVDNPKSAKGTYYLLEALQKLQNKEDYFLVIFGPSSPEFTSRIGIDYFEAGAIYNRTILSCIYTICDCFVNSSLAESFGLTSLEAISCGIPVAAFDSSGTKDVISHKVNGYLAKPFESEDLKNGIEFCVENAALLKESCLKIASEKFDKEKIINQTIKLYEEIIQGRK